VVVGEVDVDEIVAEIERLFGPAVPRSGAVPARPDTTFRVDVTPDVSFHVDPDQQTVDVEVTLPIPTGSGSGSAAVRAELVDLLIYDVLVRRLDGDLAAGRAPFDRVTRGGNSFVDALDAPALYAVTDAARARDTLLALLEEYERADRHGFTSDETDLAREAVRSLFDRRFDGRESTQDRDYATRYVNDFLRDEGYPSIEVEHRIATEILDAITPAALDRRFRARWTNSAPHVIISTPEAVAGRLPGEAEVLALIDELPERTIARRDEPRELPEALMERPAPADTNASRRLLDRGGTYFDPEEVSFANGLTLIVNPNPIVEGQVFFLAASPGGSSLVADEDVVDALYAAEVVTSSGVADLNQAELEQVLAGRDVGVGASITPYRESLSGSAATADVEQLLQLVHLYLTRPRFDPVALDQVRRRVGPVVDDPGSDPIVASDDALLDRRYPGELRYARLPEPEEFATLDLEGIERVWTDRFGDASEWVFVVAGDFDPDAVIELAASYLGTLPATGRDEQPVDVEDPPPAGVVRTTIEAGTGDTASVLLSFTSPVDDISARLRATADVVEEVIDARLSDVIREQLGESYSPRAVTRVVTDPDPAIETFLRVTGSPDRVATIADLVVGELGDLAAVGPSDQEFSSAFAHVEEAGGFVNNGEFMTELLDDAIDPARDLDDYLFESTELDRLSAETVRSFIRTHIPVDRFIQVTVLPR
jgi:zinc protease